MPRTRCGEERGRGSCRTYRIIVTETEAKSIGFVEVDWVGIKDPDVHLPFLIVIGGDEADARG